MDTQEPDVARARWWVLAVLCLVLGRSALTLVSTIARVNELPRRILALAASASELLGWSLVALGAVVLFRAVARRVRGPTVAIWTIRGGAGLALASALAGEIEYQWLMSEILRGTTLDRRPWEDVAALVAATATPVAVVLLTLSGPSVGRAPASASVPEAAATG